MPHTNPLVATRCSYMLHARQGWGVFVCTAVGQWGHLLTRPPAGQGKHRQTAAARPHLSSWPSVYAFSSGSRMLSDGLLPAASRSGGSALVARAQWNALPGPLPPPSDQPPLPATHP